MACCVSGMATTVRIDGEAMMTGEDSQERQQSPAKITGVTESGAVVRIGSVRKVLFCDETKLTELEQSVPVDGVLTYEGQNLISFEAN